MKKLLPALLAGLVLAAGAVPAYAASVKITPGTVWTDTSGAGIQAHGEGITKVGGTYY